MISSLVIGLRLYQRFIHFRPPVAEELPGVADLGDEVEGEVGGEYLVLVARRLREDAAARIAEIAGAVEFADVPGRLDADAVDGSDEVAIGDGVSGLFEPPKVLAEAGDRGGWIEHDFRAVQAERARPFGEMAVVTDVDPDLAEAEIEHRVAQVAGAEVILFPKTRRHVGDVGFAVLAQVGAILIYN